MDLRYRILKVNLTILTLLFSITQPVMAVDLLQVYQKAIDNDPLLKKVYYQQFSAAESKAQSIAKMLPMISANGRSTRDRLNNKKFNFQSAGTQNYWSHSFSVQLKQAVFHWDHWVELDQSSNRIAQAEAEYEAELQNLMLKTAEAYFNILAAKDSLEFSLAELKAIEKQMEQAQQRFDVGLIAITDVYEAKAAFDLARANLIDAENALDDSKEALIEIIGDQVIDLNTLSKEITLLAPEPNDIQQWSSVAEASNLQIIAALNQAEILRKSISLQQAGHLPTLDIIASYGSQDVNSSFGSRGDNQSVGLELNVPIFQGGMVSSRSKQANYEYKAAKEELLSVKRQVKRQLKNAFRDINSSISRVNALQAAVESANSALQASQAGAEVGTRTMVDVLNEQKNFYRSKRDYARSRYDYLISSIKLKHAASSLTERDLVNINQYLLD